MRRLKKRQWLVFAFFVSLLLFELNRWMFYGRSQVRELLIVGLTVASGIFIVWALGGSNKKEVPSEPTDKK